MTNKLQAVLWKNLLLRRNGWLMTLYELLLPLLLLLIINIWLPPIPRDKNYPSPTDVKDISNSYFRGSILYAPDNAFAKAMTNRIGLALGISRGDMVAGNILEPGNVSYSFAIDFGNSSEAGLEYVLYPWQGSWPQSLPPWKSEGAAGGGNGRYGVEGLAGLQYQIDSAFINIVNAKTNSLWLPKITIQDREASGFLLLFRYLVVLAVFASYSLLVSPVITRIVEEKQCGAKELMRMMGVRTWELWLAKLVDAALVNCMVAAGMVVLLCVPLSATSNVLLFVPPFVLFIVIFCGLISVVLGLFCLSCFFDSPVLASSVASIIGVGSYLLLGVMQLTSAPWWRRMLYCLMPHMSLINSVDVLMKFEELGKSVNWLERLSSEDSALTLAEMVTMMFVDIFLYALLTWYFDKIRPGQFGVPMPWSFFLRKNYWMPERKVMAQVKLLKDKSVPVPATAGISVHQLRKVYQGRGATAVVAVDGLNLDAPEGRITALLGHNGAGKTTTMQIITGLINATSGSVAICGHDIRLNPDLARSSLGLCPQQDLLFQNLTALQTLTFFAMIKGLGYFPAKREAEEMLKTLKMESAKTTLNKNLSGGMKRKVSLGIALIGGSKVVILDEPTAGVDPELRREICDLLLGYRGKRTVLLTTHIMEEADAISDLIFIMDHGKIQCSGTPLDLKTKFGTGYTLQVVIKKDVETKVKGLVKSAINDSTFKAHNAATMSFQLPSQSTPIFPQLFSQLDQMKAESDIVSYSVSISTLEDVFVRVRELEREATDEVDGNPYELLSSNSRLHPGSDKVTGLRLYASQMSAIFVKAFLTFKRSLWFYFGFAGIPLVLILLSEVLAPYVASHSGRPSSETHVSYSQPIGYEKTEIYSQIPSCRPCQDFATNFTSLSAARDFNPNSVMDVDEAVDHVYQKDYHHYSRYVTLSIVASENEIQVRYNSLANNIISVAINLIHNCLLRGPTISSSVDLRYVTKINAPSVETTTGPKTSSYLEVIGFQSLYYMTLMQTERQTGAKALQLMAVPAIVFWLSHFLFDMLNFIPFITISSLIYYYFEPNDAIFMYGKEFPLAIILWGGGLILISYMITCYIKTRSNSITVAILVYFVFSNVLWPFIEANLVPKWLAYLHPNTMWKLGINSLERNMMYLVSLAIYWVVMLLFLVLTESTIPSRMLHTLLSRVCSVQYGTTGQVIDEDVQKEQEEVSSLMRGAAVDTLLVSRLQRWYGLLRRRAAVRGVSFHVRPGDCFGLLGVNGAGKSTTFNMLATQIPCSGGDAVLNRSYLSDWNVNKYLSQISYCPQTSGIIPKLTGTEFLTLFARLRGYKTIIVPDVVHQWTRVLDLEECADKLCGRYSGGMERKLIAAAAFIWDASVMMLDEPTSGVDPVARRSIWKAVTNAQQAGKSVILTSHSMEECESLCSRLAIMVDGSFRCVGETTTLKNRFGRGYSVQLKLSPASPEELAAFEAAVSAGFGRGCHLTDRHCSILHYHIDDSTSWKTLFEQLEELKKNNTMLESYMASETTLEQIFLEFAGHRQIGRVTSAVDTVVDISE